MHSGIDIAAPEGSKLVCIMDGEVVSCRLGWCRRLHYYN